MAGSPAPAERPLILGIDPGLRICGWGIVRGGPQPEYVACGVIRPRTRDSLPQRLVYLHKELSRLVVSYVPDEVAIEDPFVGALSPASALAIGQARAIGLLAAGEAGLEVALYAPRAVKAAVSGYGASDKRQVQSMVRILLSLDTDPEPADAADALAAALCHLGQRRLAALYPHPIPLPGRERGSDDRFVAGLQAGRARERGKERPVRP
jgi:crossover junction endodeoxyribonuclease RuvC